jgi:hypothetical protein
MTDVNFNGAVLLEQPNLHVFEGGGEGGDPPGPVNLESADFGYGPHLYMTLA